MSILISGYYLASVAQNNSAQTSSDNVTMIQATSDHINLYQSQTTYFVVLLPQFHV